MLDEGWISREAAGIETLHLADQTLNVAQGGRLVAIGLAQLIELSHGVLITALEFGLGHGRHGAVRIGAGELAAGIAGAVVVAPAPPATIRTTIPIASADLVAVTVATLLALALAALLAAALLTLTLAGLLALALTALLALTTLLAALLALAALTLPWLPLLALTRLAGTIDRVAVHGFEVLAQALQIIQGLLFAARSLALTRLGAKGLLGLAHLIVQTLKAFRDSGLGGSSQRPVSLADPIRASFQEILQVRIFHAAESIAQLGGRITLRGRERAHGVPHLVLQAGEIRRRLLAVAGKLLLLRG